MSRMRALMMILGALDSVRAGDVNLDTGSTEKKATVKGRFTVTDSGTFDNTLDTLDTAVGLGPPDDTTFDPDYAPAADPAPTAAPTAAPAADPAPNAAPAAAPTFAGVASGALAAFAGTMAPTHAAPGLAIAAVCVTSAHTAGSSFGGGTSNGAGPSFTDPSFGADPSNGELNKCSSRTSSSEEWTDVGRPGTPSSEGTDVGRPGAPRRRRGTRASSSRTSRGALVVCVRGRGGVYGACPCTPQPAICVWAATYADGEDTLTPCVIL